MKLSVIIVNYNVKHFLEQCLFSVLKAAEKIETEIIVVDNHSADGSVQMVSEKFPQVQLIANKKNLGFSAANNQGIAISKGEFILLLNPDTVVEEDSFYKIVDFMDSHPAAGGLGVKMIDGKGRFLPESKRGLPTPAVAFYKIFGLSRLFPKSKLFNRYHLGYLSPDEIHEVEVLSGAFMLLRKKVLDKIGLLDDSFFMYGEDIDLSYRITQAGYKNIYFPETTIIHYKGESTKKGSLNYVMIFYKAMQIFARKHFSNKRASLFTLLINLAIFFRASVAVFYRIIKVIFFPLMDAAAIYGGFLILAPRWGNLHGSHYPKELFYFLVPIYVVIWLITSFLAGSYDKPVKLWNTIKGILIGTLLILILYSLLSEDFRFSRMLIFLGTMWSLTTLVLLRLIYHGLHLFGFRLYYKRQKKTAIVGEYEKVRWIEDFIQKVDSNTEVIGYIAIENETRHTKVLGNLSQLTEVVRINKINELVFSASSLQAGEIIRQMVRAADLQVNFKIASRDGLAVIGSNSVETNGELYVISLNSVMSPKNRRIKRLFDLVMAGFFLIFSPLILISVKNGSRIFKILGEVFSGRKSWIGYYGNADRRGQQYPELKKGILPPTDILIIRKLSPATVEKVNLTYSQNYSLLNDLSLLVKNFKHICEE